MRLLLGKWGNTKDRLISNLFQRATADGGVLGSSIDCIDAAYSSADNASLLTMVPAFGKAGKLYSILPESGAGDFTVVRGTTASYVAQDGLIRFAAVNEPRIDWSNGKGMLLSEGAGTNLAAFSEQFDNAAWLKFNAIINANAGTSPNGTTTAYKIVETVDNNIHILFRGILPSGISNSSIYAKQAERKYLTLGNSSFNVYAIFDLSNGTVFSISGSQISDPKIESVGNGWYRCSVTNINNDVRSLAIGVANNSGAFSYLGDGTSGLFIWGAQLESGSAATSYIPTTNAAATRNADVITTTPPAGTSEIVTTFEDGTTQVVTSIPGTFTIPNGRVAKVKMT